MTGAGFSPRLRGGYYCLQVDYGLALDQNLALSAKTTKAHISLADPVLPIIPSAPCLIVAYKV